MMRVARLAFGSDLRRGSAYLLIIQLSMLISIIGLSAIAVSRVGLQSAKADGDLTAARLQARAAIDLGLRQIALDPAGWRTAFASKTILSSETLGAGAISLSADDPDDGVIDDDPNDPLVLVGTGEQGEARYMLRVRLEPRGGGSMATVRGSWRRVVQ